MCIFSATSRIGSLSLFGAGPSVGLLVGPAPINVCIVAIAGLGVVCGEALSCCFFLRASAIAATPVKATGERRGEYGALSDFGDKSAEENVNAEAGCSRFGFGLVNGLAVLAETATVAVVAVGTVPGIEVGVRGALSRIGKGSVPEGVVARVVAAAMKG